MKNNLGWMMIAALVIRLAVVCFVYEEQFSPERDHFSFGWETGRIARSVALGEGFSSPLHGPTGPTAWSAPLYIYLLAGVFKAFGVYTTASALVILSLNSLFSALTCLTIFLIARKPFGEAIALRAGWVWAIFPYAIDFAVMRVWGDCLNAFLFTLIFLIVLRLEYEKRPLAWLRFGLLAGVILLACPAILPTLAILMGWACYRSQRWGVPWRQSAVLAVLAVLTMAAVVTPWFVRNYQTFHRFVPFRSNFWLEVRVGNTGDLSDLTPDWSHPSTSRAEMEEYRRLGEIDYMARKRRQALDYIYTYPVSFASLTIRRIVCVWTGFWSMTYFAVEPTSIPHAILTSILSILMLAGLYRAWRHQREAVIPYLLTLFSFPLIYYLTHSQAEYRHPIDPLIVVLAVYGASGMLSGIVKKRIRNRQK